MAKRSGKPPIQKVNREWDILEDETTVKRTVRLLLTRKELATVLGYPGLEFQQLEPASYGGSIVLTLEQIKEAKTDKNKNVSRS